MLNDSRLLHDSFCLRKASEFYPRDNLVKFLISVTKLWRTSG
jgi:hypothetical protein